MKKRYEEARANMKGKMLNCLVVAVVLLAVSALSGAVICVQGNGHPPGPEPNKIDVISVVPSSIPADGVSVAIITARAMYDDVPSNNRTITFQIIDEPIAGGVSLSTTDLIPPNEGKKVGNVTNDEGYAYATLKAGDVAGDVKIEVYRLDNVSDTVVVTLDTVQPPENKTNFTLEFLAGHNMISLPVNDSAVTNASSLIAKIGATCTEVFKWDESSHAWKAYAPGQPTILDFDIGGGEGCFVSMSGPVEVLFTGPGWDSPFAMSLIEGHNMIGIPVNDSSVTNASSLIAKIGSNCAEVFKWDESSHAWKAYAPGQPTILDFDIGGGEGCFVSMTGLAEVTFEGVPWRN